MKNVLIIVAVALQAISGLCQTNPVSGIRHDVFVLSADSFQGRKPGTAGDQMSAAYIEAQFRLAGLTKLNGDQGFELVTEIVSGEKNRLSFDQFIGTPGKDFSPYSFSANTESAGEAVFVGYGFDIRTKDSNWDDYGGKDVSGKWVVMFRGHPGLDNENSMFSAYSKERSKVLVAKDKGAVGVIFVTPLEMDKNDELVSLFYDKSKGGAGIPVFNVKRSVASLLLEGSGCRLDAAEQAAAEGKPSGIVYTGKIIKAVSDVVSKKVTTANVVAMLPSDKVKNDPQYIVIGAHYDHLGMGGHGSGSRMPDTMAVHNGADDNASGVAGILALARMMGAAGNHSRYHFLFVAFGAEESGLVGSNHFIEQPPVDKSKIKLMINFDMIGRLGKFPARLNVGGTGTFSEAETLLQKHCDSSRFLLHFNPEGYGPSDHAAFYAAGIPVLYFNTGAHADYHTPFDDREKINCEGIDKICQYVFSLLTDIGSGNYAMQYAEAGPLQKSGHREGLKVTLGIIPDFNTDRDDGLGVGAVTKGGPAERGGLLKGDVITALDGKPIHNIYEYMDRLKSFVSGQIISVDIIRTGEKKVLLVQL